MLGDTLDFKFSTVGTTGAPTTLAGSPVVSAYVDNSTTQLTAGITLSVDFDGVTGLQSVRVVASGANGYAAQTNVDLVITTGTVGGTSVVGYVVGSFSIENRSTQAIKTQTAAIEVDTQDIQSRIPAALVSGRIDASVGAMANNTLTAAALAVDAATEIADSTLNRDMSAVSDTNARSPLNALRFLRNKWDASGTTLTVKKEDDSTTAWTATLTAAPGADPISGSDPA